MIKIGAFRIVDLTHELHSAIPTWNGGCGWREELKVDYPEGLRIFSYKCHAGIGTHLDAPSHFFEGSWNIADIPLEQLLVPACVLDVSQEAHADFLIGQEHLARYEEAHGRIEKGALFLAHTGWSRFWRDPQRYRNPDAKGKMHFPGLAKEAAEFLLERDVAGVGIDTLSPDGSSEGFAVHEKILGARKYLLENLCHLDALPPRGALAIALPMKVRLGTEAATRAIALVDK